MYMYVQCPIVFSPLGLPLPTMRRGLLYRLWPLHSRNPTQLPGLYQPPDSTASHSSLATVICCMSIEPIVETIAIGREVVQVHPPPITSLRAWDRFVPFFIFLNLLCVTFVYTSSSLCSVLRMYIHVCVSVWVVLVLCYSGCNFNFAVLWWFCYRHWPHLKVLCIVILNHF